MSTELSPGHEQFIHDVVASGQFRDRTEVLERAIELLKRRERLRHDVGAGVTQLDRGEFTEYDEDSLDRFLNDIKAEAERLPRKGATS